MDSPLGVGAAAALVLAILAMAPLAALASRDLRLRARRAEPGDLRRGLSLAANASLAIPAAYTLCIVVGFSGGDTTMVGAVENVAALAIAATAWVGIVKYGLFDLRTVAGRGLVYAALTVVVVAVYSGVSALLGGVFAGTVPAIVAAAVGAMAVLPLRDRLQRRVNRFVFGLRDDPAAAFGLLGVRLDAAAAPDDVLPAAARTVAEALRLRYVGIEVGGEHLGRWGEPVAGPVHHVDLPFAGESIGRLVLQRREPREPFSRADLALVDSLASHLGLAARAVALTHVERASHARMIAVREEERIRLRRKLHDELGPTLAGIALGIDTARRSLDHGTAASTDELLAPLRAEAERAVTDIRRIAYNLRPPVLDQLGLGPALSEEALRMGRANVSIPAQLPPLPALVEVAAYRIATEAMINAARHAPGASVEVRVSVTGSDLELEVSDTGAGLPEGFRAGVGITSMRERAAELGGRLILTTLEPHGTRVLAHLPIGSAAL